MGTRYLEALLDVRRDRIRFVTRSVEAYGDIVCFRMPHRNLVLLRHPEHIRHVLCENPGNYRKGLGLRDATDLLGDGLLTSDGDLWTSRRRISADSVSTRPPAELSSVGGRGGAPISGSLGTRGGEQRCMDAGGEFAIATLRIATRALFEAELDDAVLAESRPIWISRGRWRWLG